VVPARPGPTRIVAAATIPKAAGRSIGAARSPGLDRSLLDRAAAMSPGGNRTLIGRIIGDRYGVKALIGEGGMGEVYEAEHLAMGRLVAVKVLNANRSQDPEAVSRLRHEARVAGTLGHPNICAIYDMGRLDDGSPYLVMERLHGETLAQRLERETRLPVDELLDIMVQVLSALSVAHQRGVIHRDLKPDNIFLARREGSRPLPKLLDFGISKSEDIEETMADLTAKTVAAGTPFYMAPEQARGDRVDHRVDLWATGIILYECLSGQRPFDARNYNALLVQILTAAPRPLGAIQPDVPSALARIVEKALSKSPDDRYQSALDIQSGLRAVNLIEVTASKVPATRKPTLGSDLTNDDPDGTFVFSRAAIGLRDGEPTSERMPLAPTPPAPMAKEPISVRSALIPTPRAPAVKEPISVRTPVAPPPPPPVVTIPRPMDSEAETTGVYLPFTDDDEGTTVDELKRDTIPMPPRKE
jgi:eukaryotic-like serine/threonine-protein kinase